MSGSNISIVKRNVKTTYAKEETICFKLLVIVKTIVITNHATRNVHTNIHPTTL